MAGKGQTEATRLTEPEILETKPTAVVPVPMSADASASHRTAIVMETRVTMTVGP